MIVLKGSGSTTAANICGTSKYNILKEERDYVFCQLESQKIVIIQKNTQELNIKMNQIYEAINIFSNPKVVLLPQLSFPIVQLSPPQKNKENKEKEEYSWSPTLLKNISVRY